MNHNIVLEDIDAGAPTPQHSVRRKEMMYRHRFPSDVVESDGPFEEFAHDAAIVTVETDDGSYFTPVVLVYPNFVGAMPDVEDIPFDPHRVIRILQSPENLKQRSSSDWTFFTQNRKIAEQSGGEVRV